MTSSTEPAAEQILKAWRVADAIRYALATGFGQDELERRELPFVYEGRGLLVSPSFATTLRPQSVPKEIGAKGENSRLESLLLEIFTPLLPSDTVTISEDVSRVMSSSQPQEIVISSRSEVHREADARAVCAIQSAVKYAAVVAASEFPQRAEPDVPGSPDRRADFSEVFEIADHQLPLYRLCGDERAHGVDNDAARRAGHQATVVPSLCLLGHVCRVVLATVCDYDPTLVRRISAHFAAHAQPSDTLTLMIWQDGPVLTFGVKSLRQPEFLVTGEVVLAG